MTVVSVELINENAMSLLEDLERMDILKVQRESSAENTVNWAEKYKGRMSKQSLEEVERELKELRDSWE